MKAKDEREDALRPDLQVKGTNAGEGKASVAMAFWFVNRAPEKPPVDWRPTAWTLAFDLSAQTKDGLGQLLLGSSDGEQTVSAPVTWSFGASVGMMGQYTARELFGDAPFQPSESIIASMDRALSTCDDVCAINKDAKGCDKFRKFTTGARDDRLDRWFVTNVALTPKQAASITAELNELLPAGVTECKTAQGSLVEPVNGYVAAGEAMEGSTRLALAKAFSAAVATCSAACEKQESAVTPECRRAMEMRAALKVTEAQWCETKGVVGDMSSSPRANACRSLVVGKPSATHKLLLDAYVGFVDVANGLYRVAIGPRLTWSNPEGDADPTRTVGVRVPFSLNLLAAPRNEQKLDYDGLIRVTPYYEASWTGDEDTVHSGGLVLELLGKRSLFSTKYDEL